MSLDHPDHAPYKKFVRRQIVDKSIHTLHGMLTGISLDSMIVKSEVVEVLKWAKEYKTYVNHPPFNEIIPKIEETFRCEKIDEETHRDLIWLCENISLNGVYYDKLTHDIQILHGIMHGILADGVITIEELKSLEKWIEEHDHLKGSYPYDELESQIMSILSDGKVSEEEAKSLNEFFTDFINYSLHRKIKETRNDPTTKVATNTAIMGVCSTCPDLIFENRKFALTGTSKKFKRSKIIEIIKTLGGEYSNSVTGSCDYLIVGSSVNPSWAYACYGRKVEQALDLRKKSHNIIIAHENDFWDSAMDNGIEL